MDKKEAEEKLAAADFKELKKSQVLAKFAKDIVEGEMVEMVCHLKESDNGMGRSLVIDLGAPHNNNFRQVDHRTIQWIIFKNIKYELGKRDPGYDELPVKPESGPKWKESKLSVGNWFSQIQYYKVT